MVFENYSPIEHHLEVLSHYVKDYLEEAKYLLKKDTKRFEILDKAYIWARYHPATKPFKAPPKYFFNVTQEDLEFLEPDVIKLLELTEKRCKEYIWNIISSWKKYRFDKFRKLKIMEEENNSEKNKKEK